jgi:hypothetical protein
MSACCDNCRFVFAWDSVTGTNRTCRRFPPTALMAMVMVKPTPANPQGVVQQPTGMFPPTAKEAWCGEYAPKAEPQS